MCLGLECRSLWDSQGTIRILSRDACNILYLYNGWILRKKVLLRNRVYKQGETEETEYFCNKFICISLFVIEFHIFSQFRSHEIKRKYF